MAQGMKEIKRRIKSVQNTKQITRALEMVSASKLRRAQERAESARPYAEKIKEVIAGIASGSANVNHPMLQKREVKKTGYIVITSDRGQAGGYNANLLRLLTTNIARRHKSKDEYSLIVLGRKGSEYLKNRNHPIVEELTGLSDYPTFADIKEITRRSVALFADEKVDELYIYYNRFISAIEQKPTEAKLLPLEDVGEQTEEQSRLYEYEPSAEEVLNDLLPQYAETLIFSSLLDAKASEHGARMTAMGNATRNASEMIDTLTLSYNRARQASITQEISEIVGGASALE